jgi:hypothetical protein
MQAARALLPTLLLCLISAPATASADEGIAILPGLTTGIGLLHTGLDTPGWTIGGEVSVLYYEEDIQILAGRGALWAVGGYIDALRDLGSESTRISLGPELTWWCFGFDGGYMLQIHDAQVGHGITGRLFISALVPALYVRGGKTWGPIHDAFMEIGITLKVPFIKAFPK